MRTPDEVLRQIEGIRKQRERLPEHNFFGDDNYAAFDAQIEILQGSKTYDDYEDDESYTETEAYRAKEWLEGNSDEDLFDEE